MDLQEADGQITEEHSIRNLRRDSRQTFIDGTSLTVQDVLERPEILDLVLQNATPEGAPDYSSLLRAPLKFSTACQKLRDIAIMVRDYVIRYAREHPYLFALNIGLTVVGFAVPLLLGGLGFTGAGVAAGSAAAAWQSSLGVVARGSLFSICQSIGATGSAPMITAVANISRWALSGFAALQEMLRSREGGRDEPEPEPRN